jgi:hypothetical protein
MPLAHSAGAELPTRVGPAEFSDCGSDRVVVRRCADLARAPLVPLHSDFDRLNGLVPGSAID